MEHHERNRLYERHYARTQTLIRQTVWRLPRHLREEAEDELRVRALELTGEYDGRGEYEAYMTATLRFALLDWLRSTARGASRGDKIRHDVELVDALQLHSADASPARHLEVLEAIRAIAQLPERERIAFSSPTRTAMAALGVTESRISQLRKRAAEILVGLGVAELLELSA